MWQIRIWINARTPEVVNVSPVNLGWQIKEGVIKAVMYISETDSELIYDLTCHCKGKKHCQRNCPCYISNLLCIELCVCESDERNCHNPHTFDIDELASNIEQDHVFLSWKCCFYL